MKDTNAEVKEFLANKIKPSSQKSVVLKALDRLKRKGMYVEDDSEEYGYPNYRVRTEEAYVRVYKSKRLGWQIQPWEYVTFTYSETPTFFGGSLKGARE